MTIRPPDRPERARFARCWIAVLIAASGCGPMARAQAVTDAPARADRAATLREGDTGAAVEALQRALNARMDPSPGLDVDGDFGAGTKAAVARFQRSRGLEPSGAADPKTREALGPPPAAEPPPPRPEVVNLAPRGPKQPADAPDGPPFVTAKGWAVADGRTGAVLWGQDEAKPLEMASLTKVMTALVVVRLAKVDPKVLDEVVTFSETADATPGSTSGVRAGERVPVRELLYGLLLPSGNDAATAFSEHFGGRLEGPAGSDPAGFIAEMNRTAGALGLAETHFANPHGLPADGHRSSARDLARLASAALAEPEFASRVATPRRGCTLVGPDGATRDVAWTNTNRLLDIEGYDGVKTGTTNGAGACLIASGRRGGDHLIVVILGSGTSDARYADARNLFRWAWSRRGTK